MDQRQHERQRVVAVEFEELRLRFRRPRTPADNCAVEDQAFVDCDRLDEAVRPDVCDQRIESLALQQRQDVGVRVRLHLGAVGLLDEGSPTNLTIRLHPVLGHLRWASTHVERAGAQSESRAGAPIGLCGLVRFGRSSRGSGQRFECHPLRRSPAGSDGRVRIGCEPDGDSVAAVDQVDRAQLPCRSWRVSVEQISSRSVVWDAPGVRVGSG